MMLEVLLVMGSGGHRGDGGNGSDGGDDGKCFGSVVTAGARRGQLDRLQQLRLSLGCRLLLQLLQVLRLYLDDLRLSRELARVGHLNRRDMGLLLLLLVLTRRPLLFDGNPVHVDARESGSVRDDRVSWKENNM